MTEKIKFLCGHFEMCSFIYGIRFADYDWHYFEMKDSIASEHNLLPDRLHSLIGTLDKVKTIEVHLNDEELKHYFSDGKFIFKNNELKTRLSLVNEQFGDRLDVKSSKTKSTRKSTDKLVFICGKSNPLLFINEFEKCTDVSDRMFKIRNFVNDSHRVEFSELCFTSDWATVKQTFLKKYSLSFTLNKKRELNIDFGEEESLRLFVERKLIALSSYTTLPFINQMEITLNDLPGEISNLFIINEMMNKDKMTILEFCDSIQDIVATMQQKPNEPEAIPKTQNKMNQMKVFNFDPDLESSDQQSVESVQVTGSGRGRVRPPKNLSQSLTDESTNSPWTDQNISGLSTTDNSPQYRGKTKRVVSRGRVVKSCPSKMLKIIEEQIGSKSQSVESMDTE